MTDYAEERQSEREVLESIYPDELTIISDDQLSIRVEPETQRPDEPYVLNLHVTYTPTYPDELPSLEIECEQGELTEHERQWLLNELKREGEDNLGMAMVYTLSQFLRDALAQVLVDRKRRQDEADAERYRLEEEAQARKTAGTKVTPESFAQWRTRFEAELADKRDKEEQDRIRALPPKERDEVKRALGKLSGRELFARQLAKDEDVDVDVDDGGGDEGEDEGGEVDYERYERERKARVERGEAFEEDDRDEDEEARARFKAVQLSDEE